jgi:spore maturation protein CgeB
MVKNGYGSLRKNCMNILVVGRFYVEGFALHIAETLTAMGMVVRRFEPGLKSATRKSTFGQRVDQVRETLYSASDGLPKIRARRIRSLWEVADIGPLDLVLVCHDFLWPEEVAELKRRSKAKVVMWFPDALTNFGRAFFMNASYDALFFKDPYIVSTLSGVLHSPVYYLPECFNPSRHFVPDHLSAGDDQYKCEITTAGNQHAWRISFFEHLRSYDVKLWGNAAPLWMNTDGVNLMLQNRSVNWQVKALAFRSAKIVLNNLHYGEIWGLNVRTFEAAGIGAFQMVNWRPSLSQLFKPNEELIAFTNMDELKLKLDYWLPRDDERKAIASAGMRRAHSDHTYTHRLSLLISTAMQSESGYPMPTVRYRA